MFKCFILLLQFIYNINCFKITNKLLYKKNNLQLFNDIYQDLDNLYNYKNNFQNENYSDIIKSIMNNEIEKIFINVNYKELVVIDNLPKDDYLYYHYHFSNIEPIILPNLIEKASNLNIPLYFVNFNSNNIITNYGFQILFLFSFLLFYFLNFIPKINYFEKNNLIKLNISLDNWVGNNEIIEDCREVVSYINNKEKYKEMGLEIPKGILLNGPSGTGKTYLVKAIASETKSTLITISGSEFVKLYLGQGAYKIKELFKNAKKNNFSIIFIDGIDVFSKQHNTPIRYDENEQIVIGYDENEQILNQLLYEIDKLDDNIIIIATTKMIQNLNKELLKPDRFNKIINISLPNEKARYEIIEYYFKNKNLNKSFNITEIVYLTDGFSGAQLKKLINEAGLISIKNNYTSIQEKYIFTSYEQFFGETNKNNTKLRISIHESGHALLVLFFNEYFNFIKSSIKSTYSNIDGYTLFSEKIEIKNNNKYSKDILKKKLIIIMGGKAAESLYYNDDYISLATIQNLKEANILAKKIIENSIFNYDNDNIKSIINSETIQLVNEAYLTAKKILAKKKDKLIYFSELLQNNIIVDNNDYIDNNNDYIDNNDYVNNNYYKE